MSDVQKLKRKDYKYDLLIPIKYNFKNPVILMCSCIFIHLTQDYKPTAGCVALKKKDEDLLFIFIHECTHAITPQVERKVKMSTGTPNTKSNG